MTFRRALGLIAFTFAIFSITNSVQAQSDTGHYYVVTVDFGTAPENFDRFKQIMNENAKASVMNEPGCREFNVYEVASAPNHLFLFEVYDDDAAFQQHVNSAHFKHFKDVSDPIITSRAGSRGTMFASYRKP
ncbi:MAG TPA: putative quinol monooxygenase [Rhizomicrobium sp.]|nr:putative quinol monooxygenase [Rhizomicrobium sp.]